LKTIHSEFRQFCHEHLSSNSNADKVCSFYRKYIKVVGVKSSLEAKKRNIKAILSNYNETVFIDVIDYFLDMERRGTLKELTLPYFEKCVENKFVELSSKSHTFPSTKPNTKKPMPINKTTLKIEEKATSKDVVVPIIHNVLNQQLNTSIPIQENFMFLCPKCSNAIPGFFDFCTQCESIIDYTKVDFKDYLS